MVGRAHASCGEHLVGETRGRAEAAGLEIRGVRSAAERLGQRVAGRSFNDQHVVRRRELGRQRSEHDAKRRHHQSFRWRQQLCEREQLLAAFNPVAVVSEPVPAAAIPVRGKINRSQSRVSTQRRLP